MVQLLLPAQESKLYFASEVQRKWQGRAKARHVYQDEVVHVFAANHIEKGKVCGLRMKFHAAKDSKHKEMANNLGSVPFFK